MSRVKNVCAVFSNTILETGIGLLMDQLLSPPPQRRLRVLMLTEGTYPFHWGGVSTWCHLLMRDLPNIDFELVSLTAEPNMELQFALPGNVKAFHPIPLWGVRERLETRQDLTLRALWARQRRTTEAMIAQHFAPLFGRFVQELFLNQSGPQQMAHTIHGMHRFFLTYDFDTTMRSQAVWHMFVTTVQASFPVATAQFGYPDARYQLAELTTAMHWLYHWLFPLGAPLPKSDVVHAAMVGICTMIGVAAKLEHGAAFMLTEHGIYLRERYLAEATTTHSFFFKVFNLCFARRMTELTYALADQISPCCDYNQRWELRNGARPEQIRTIYYGVDGDTFLPTPKPFGEPPVVVWVGRIDPLKDLVTLIRAAGIVHQSRPDIQFKLFGSAPAGNESYYEKCLELRKELDLEETVIFAGYQSNVVAAFNEGDIVVLSSISEAFPFVILEAMLCAKPVVATGVGGIPEQLEGCGFALEPRNPEAMAAAILNLMGDPALCATLGQAARVKASREFTVRQSGLAHEASYRRIMKRHQLWQAQQARQRRAFANCSQPPVLLRRRSNAPSAVTSATNPQPIDAAKAIKVNGTHNGYADPKGHHRQPAPNGAYHDNDHLSGTSVGSSANSLLPETYAATWLMEQPPSQYSLFLDGKRSGTQPTGGKNGSSQHENDNLAVKNSLTPTPNGDGVLHTWRMSTRSFPTTAEQVGHRFTPTADEYAAWSPTPSCDDTWRKAYATAIKPLALEVAQRNREPIDALQITAIIESMGVTDEVAQQRYGATDAFVLGEALFEELRTAGMPLQPVPPVEPLRQSRWEVLRNLSHGFLGLLPAVILLFCIFAYNMSSQWGQHWVLALSAGMTCSMLITNGFIQAVSRRTSIYLGLKKLGIAGRFLWQSTALIFVGLFTLDLLAVLLTSQLGIFSNGERLIFSVAFLSLSALWLAAGGLALIQRSGWLSAAMVSGLLIGALLDYCLQAVSGWHLIIGSLVGYGVVMALIITKLRQGYADHNPKTKTAKKLYLPSRAYLFAEATPYFAYGFVYMLFILLPHMLGWLGTLGVHQMRSWAVTSVEMGLTASMPPLILASGVAEHALRRFWSYTPVLQAQTESNDLPAFRRALGQFYQRFALIHLITLVALSIGTYFLFRLAVSSGLITHWLHLPDTEQLLFIFTGGLIAYGLLGVGVFNAMFCITLNAPQLATRAIWWGLVVTLLVGAPLSSIHYTLSALAFISGALVFVLISWKMCYRILQSADHRFAAAL